jgi:hypothetical protein
MEQIETRNLYRELPDVGLTLDREVFDYSVVPASGENFLLVWSEYDIDSEVVRIYSCVFDKGKWEEPILAYEGSNTWPPVKVAAAKDNKSLLVLARSKGSKDELILKTYDGTCWGSEQRIIEIEAPMSGYDIAASQKRNQLYVVFGNYRERHYLPYIFSAIITGHTSREFGKLYLIKGDSISWIEPVRITKQGRFSCSNPVICLCDEKDILNIAWEDERHGYRRKAVYYDSFSDNRFLGNREISMTKYEAFSPLVTCDDGNNIFLACSTSENEEQHNLSYSERIGDAWSKPVELADNGIVTSINVDNARNVHIMWVQSNKINLKMKLGLQWTKTITFDAHSAKSLVDSAGNIHIVLLSHKHWKKSVFTYKKLEFDKRNFREIFG